MCAVIRRISKVFVGSVEAKSVVHDMLNLTCISLYRRIQYTVEMS